MGNDIEGQNQYEKDLETTRHILKGHQRQYQTVRRPEWKEKYYENWVLAWESFTEQFIEKGYDLDGIRDLSPT